MKDCGNHDQMFRYVILNTGCLSSGFLSGPSSNARCAELRIVSKCQVYFYRHGRYPITFCTTICMAYSLQTHRWLTYIIKLLPNIKCGHCINPLSTGSVCFSTHPSGNLMPFFCGWRNSLSLFLIFQLSILTNPRLLSFLLC